MINRVERIDHKLSALRKPLINRIDDIYIGPDDLLILVGGFEDRAYGILDRLTPGSSGFKAIVLKYKPYIKENKIEDIRSKCEALNVDIIEEFIYDRHQPAGAGDRLVDMLCQNDIKGKIYLDVSAMSRLFIVQALVAIGTSERRFSGVRVLYSEALHYPPEKDEVEKEIEKNRNDNIYRMMFLSSGVYEVTVVSELSTVAMQGQPVRLIAFPSFNSDQLASLRGEVYPSYFTFIHGKPPIASNGWRLEAIKSLNHTESILNREDEVMSTLDYRETLNSLLEIYDRHGDVERLIIAPTGSKMQTVAIGIFRTFMNDIQVVYPTPNRFSSPHNYTKGVKDIYCLALDDFNI